MKAACKKGFILTICKLLSQGEKEEALLSLQSALLTLKAFWANMDCRRFLDEVFIAYMLENFALRF